MLRKRLGVPKPRCRPGRLEPLAIDDFRARLCEIELGADDPRVIGKIRDPQIRIGLGNHPVEEVLLAVQDVHDRIVSVIEPYEVGRNLQPERLCRDDVGHRRRSAACREGKHCRQNGPHASEQSLGHG